MALHALGTCYGPIATIHPIQPIASYGKNYAMTNTLKNSRNKIKIFLPPICHYGALWSYFEVQVS